MQANEKKMTRHYPYQLPLPGLGGPWSLHADDPDVFVQWLLHLRILSVYKRIFFSQNLDGNTRNTQPIIFQLLIQFTFLIAFQLRFRLASSCIIA